MADEYVYTISSRYLQLLHETWQKQALFASFRDFAVIFQNLFFYRLQKWFRVIFGVLCENHVPIAKNMYLSQL